MRNHLASFIVLTALTASAGHVSAQDNGFGLPGGELGAANLSPGQIYVGATGSVMWLELPNWTYGGDTGGGPMIDIEADGPAWGGHGFIGLGLGDVIGRNTRLQLSGGYATGDLDGSDSGPDIFTDRWVLLSAEEDVGVVPGGFEANLEVEHEAYEFGLRGLTDLNLNESVTLTPSIMVFRGGSKQDYSAAGFDGFEHSARQEVDTHQIGVEGTLAATLNVNEVFAIVMGGRGGLVHLDADMDGSDCHNVAPSGACVTPLASSVSDSYEESTYRAGLFGGTTFTFGPERRGVSLSLFGSVDWVPYAVINNPTDTIGGGGTPSHLSHDHAMAYGLSGSLSVPLN